ESSRPIAQRLCDDYLAYHFMAWWLKLASTAYLPVPAVLIDRSLELRGAGVSAFIAVRTRLFDEFVSKRISEGARQFVILGAGLDSRAYRLSGLLKGIATFEVDHPLSQKVKKERVREYFGALPDYVSYVAADLTHNELLPALLKAGYDPLLPTVFTLEGLIMYLDEDTNRHCLQSICEHSGPGSSVIFDYIYASALDSRRYEEVRHFSHYWQFMFNEPLRFGIEKGGAADYLVSIGFDRAEDFPPHKLYEQYIEPVAPRRSISDVYAIAAGFKKA
ncbi:MAG: class I SAM-dependent methyltransferase, partial [Syntrophomonadaceae bacterium]|nr:class I SAM-dependent methyltransferase [Syntrophomonadaceae bacterium]